MGPKGRDPRTVFDPSPLSVVQPSPPDPFSIPASPADVQALAQRRKDTAKMVDLKKRIKQIKQEQKPLSVVGAKKPVWPQAPTPGQPGFMPKPGDALAGKIAMMGKDPVIQAGKKLRVPGAGPPQVGAGPPQFPGLAQFGQPSPPEDYVTGEPQPQVSQATARLSALKARPGRKGIPVSKLYDAISKAEGADWARTSAKGTGSSAYGPAQLTKNTAMDFRDKRGMNWSPEEKTFLDKFIKQGEMFLKVGGEDMESALQERGLTGQAAENFRKTWGYGGSGAIGKTSRDRKMYEKVVKKMMLKIHKRTGNDTKAFWREWRFGQRGGLDPNKLDSRYANEFNQSLGG